MDLQKEFEQLKARHQALARTVSKLVVATKAKLPARTAKSKVSKVDLVAQRYIAKRERLNHSK